MEPNLHSSLQEKILVYLKDKKASFSQIAKEIGANKRWVEVAAKQLEQNGKIKYIGGRQWTSVDV